MNRRLSLALALALASCAPALLPAQTIRQLTRATATTGSNDSLVFAMSDSAARTRGLSGTELKRTLSRGGAFDSLFATKLRLGTTVSNAATWSSIQTFAAGQLVDSATGAARSQTLTTARTFWGLSFNGSANVSGKPAFASAWSSTGRDSLLAGSALAFAANDTVYGQPVWNATQAFATAQRVDSATGAQRSQTLTTARTLWGVSFDGSANVTAKAAFGSGLTVTGIDSLLAGSRLAFAANDTVYGTPVWNAVQTFATGQLVDSAVGAARSQILTTTRALWSNNFNGSAAITGALTGANGTASLPQFSFSGDPNTGVYNFGADTLGFATGGSASFYAVANNLIGGGTGSASALTLRACKCNSGQAFIQTTNSSGSVQNAVSFGTTTANSPLAIFIDRVRIASGTVAAPALNFVSDSATGLYRVGANQVGVATNATAALRINEVQQSLHINGTAALPSVGFIGDSITGIYRFGVDTLGIAVAGAAGMTFPAAGKMLGVAGNMTVTAGTGASRTMTLQSTNASSVALSTLVLGADTSVTAIGRFLAPNATVTLPAYSFSGATADGLYRPAGDTITFSINGVRGLSVLGGATAKMIGGAGDMTLIAGTGNSRRFTGQTTTSGGTATTFLRANELQQSLFADGAVGTPGIGFAADTILGLYRVGTAGANDTLMVAANGVVQMKIAPAGILRLPALPVEGSTKNAVCWDGTTFNVTQNAAATCTVSSSRFKHDIVPLTQPVAEHVVFGLHPVTFAYNADSVRAIGVIAENADSVDSRLATRDALGRVHSINYEQITASLLLVVQGQRDRIDSLAARLSRAEARIDSLRALCRGSGCILIQQRQP